MDTQSETTLAILLSSWHFTALRVTTSALKKLKAHREPPHVCSSTFNKVEWPESRTI